MWRKILLEDHTDCYVWLMEFLKITQSASQLIALPFNKKSTIKILFLFQKSFAVLFVLKLLVWLLLWLAVMSVTIPSNSYCLNTRVMYETQLSCPVMTYSWICHIFSWFYREKWWQNVSPLQSFMINQFNHRNLLVRPIL